MTVFAQSGCGKETLELFEEMQLEGVKPNQVTFLSVLDACAALEDGQKIHAAIINNQYDQDVAMGNALIKMYGSCGSVYDAESVFDRMPHQNVVSWTAMMAACTENGHSNKALHLFQQMQGDGIKPDEVTFVCSLDACASLAALEVGQEIHAAIVTTGYEKDVVVGNALVNMYGKCGNLCKARSMFHRMPYHDVVSWTAIIAACAQNGQSKEAVDLFHEMQLGGVKPDKVTFICILNACNHLGWVDAGRCLFVSIAKDHGITHTGDHYMCMIDILGRSGHLDEAEILINNMPHEKIALAWLSLLSACRIHGDVERGVRAASHCFEFDQHNATPYVMLSNIYASAGKWDDATKIRLFLKGSGLYSLVA